MLHTLVTARSGLETTRNTAILPTRKVYFNSGMHAQEVATIRPAEQRASYFESFRAYAGLERNSFDFSGDLTFEDAVFWLNLHVKGIAAGTAGGAGDTAAITWPFIPAAASDDLKSATLQWGATDGPTLWEIPGALGEELKIGWKKGEEVKLTSKLLSPKGATQIGALTGVGTDRTTISALGTKTAIYTDGSTIGSTVDDVEEVGFTLTNGFKHRDSLDATAVAKELKRPDPRHWELEVTRYFGTKTELDAYLLKTERKVRVETVGPIITGTSSNILRKLTLDCYGVWDKHAWTEVDGLIYARMTLLPLYDATAATDFSLTVINDLASIT